MSRHYFIETRDFDIIEIDDIKWKRSNDKDKRSILSFPSLKEMIKGKAKMIDAINYLHRLKEISGINNYYIFESTLNIPFRRIIVDEVIQFWWEDWND